MLKMSKMSCGIMYAIKQNREGDYMKSIITFMSKYTDTDPKYYTNIIIENLLSSAVGDLLNCMLYPCSFWSEYWRMKHYPWNMSDFDAICSALSVVQVKEGNTYINGFWDFEEYNSLI